MITANIHPSSTIDDKVYVNPQAQIGPNCHLQGNITIDSGAILKGGITLIGDIVVGRNSVLEPGVCIASPKPGHSLDETVVRLGSDVHIGAGAILLSGVKIGHHAWIEAGTVVLRNIPSHAIVGGNPASINGYLDDAAFQGSIASIAVSETDTAYVQLSLVHGVTVHRYARIRDVRGNLAVGEFEKNVPFRPKRYFIVYDVPSMETRGEHAHIKCHQFLICVAGKVSVVVDDGTRREEVQLDNPNTGLLIPAGVWGTQYKYSTNGVLLVFASEFYEEGDYIRNYDDFLKFRGLSL